MSKHVECGRVYDLNDEEMRKLADGMQAEQLEIHDRYISHCSFFLSMLRQRSDEATASPADEDAEIAGGIYGCEACTAYFFAHTAMRNQRVAQLLADTIRWIEKMKAQPDTKTPVELADMPLPEGKAN